ncbi:MAG: IPTL-CTERM sorting domain-containing protein [Chitinophagales bacterium]
MQKTYIKIYPNVASTPKKAEASSQQSADNLRQKLMQVAAFATPLVALAGMPMEYAQATIQPGTVPALATANGSNTSIGIDIDGDSNPEFFLTYYQSAALGSFVYFQGAGLRANKVMGTYSTLNIGLGTYFINAMSKLSSAITVNSSTILSSYGTFAARLFSSSPNIAPPALNGLPPSASDTGGQFFNQTGYTPMIIEMSSTGELHMAWVQVSVTDASSVQLLAFAYEDCPISAGATSIVIGATTGGSTACEAQAIPTLSEWGLITLAIFLMTFGTLYIGRREEILEGIGASKSGNKKSSIKAVWQRPTFNWKIFQKTLLGTGVLAAIAGLLTYAVYGSIAAVDVFGTAVAGPLFAYLTHLLWVFEAEKKEDQ